MLSFKKGNYNLKELQMMEVILDDCIYDMPCHDDGCISCEWNRVCDDFSRCLEYVHKLVQEKIEESS